MEGTVLGQGGATFWSDIKVIGDDLPGPYEVFTKFHSIDVYRWGHVLMRYLFEKQPQVVNAMTEKSKVSSRNYLDYIAKTLPSLTDDFRRYLRELAAITIERIEPITLFLDEEWHLINIDEYFRTSRIMDVTGHDTSSETVTLAVGSYATSLGWMREREIGTVRSYFLITPSAPGTAQVTVTATTRDGESAKQTFTVNVVGDLQTRAITLRDAVSTEEGATAINLASYFSGPALSDIEFTVASSDTDVVRVAVRDGRLVITAVAVGEADIALRSIYHGRETTQTFTVTITDDCPSYLCGPGFFNGWRWLLLEDGQAVATETD